jgi:hypothetical protein
MRNPTQAAWNLPKERRKERHRSLIELPDDLFLADDDDGSVEPPPARISRRRQFRRYDETWAAQMLASEPLVSRGALLLALVLLAEADFHERIKVTAEITKAARLTRFRKRAALQDLERLGLIKVEWRGNGRAPIVTPLNLGGRPGRR